MSLITKGYGAISVVVVFKFEEEGVYRSRNAPQIPSTLVYFWLD
jgi:hypothetical protein